MEGEEEGEIAPHLLNRTWRNAEMDASLQGIEFRLFSHNILADSLAMKHRYDLYRSVSDDCMDWHCRWKCILNEIRYYEPTVVCFQEVDRYSSIEGDMMGLGYTGTYLQRSGSHQDGCATFWSSKFDLIDIVRICFSRTEALRDNVATICVLKCKKQETTTEEGCGHVALAVANTHLLFNPKRGDIRLAQLRIVFDALSQACSARYNDCEPSVGIVAGDFNTDPDTPLYNFMTTGSLSIAHHTSKTLSFHRRHPEAAPIENWLSVPPWHPYPEDAEPMGADISRHRWWTAPDEWEAERKPDADRDNISRIRCRRSMPYDIDWSKKSVPPAMRQSSYRRLRNRFPFLSGWPEDRLEIVMGMSMPDILELSHHRGPGSFLLDHDVPLKSAYRNVCGWEPDCTTVHHGSMATVDYLLYTDINHGFSFFGRHQYTKLEPMRILEVPEMEAGMKLPMDGVGSDHFSLCADFRIRWTHCFKDIGLPLPLPTPDVDELYRLKPIEKRKGGRQGGRQGGKRGKTIGIRRPNDRRPKKIDRQPKTKSKRRRSK